MYVCQCMRVKVSNACFFSVSLVVNALPSSGGGLGHVLISELLLIGLFSYVKKKRVCVSDFRCNDSF